MGKNLTLPVLVALALSLAIPPTAPAAEPTRIAGLHGPVKVVRDGVGVPHVYARSELDAFFMMGYLHAEDRFFQMDQSRRQAAGRLAELLGPGALSTDASLRTIGLHRAAARSLAALSPQAVAGLRAYAGGVNAWLAANQLPSEYQALELTKATVPEWTALDTVAVGKLLAFGLSFDLDDIERTQKLVAYQTAGATLGFDGRKLFFEDVMRSDPFAHAPSIFPGETSGPIRTHGRPAWSSAFLRSNVDELAEKAMQVAEAAEIPELSDRGSNIWVVSGAKSATGRPMVANDPHLSLSSPPVFYEAGIRVVGKERMTLYGVTFPGTPLIVQGTNGPVSWGSTVAPTDVTDVYQEKLDFSGGAPATTYQGTLEPTTVIPETFRANQAGNGTLDDLAVVPPAAGVPAATVVVPRRNNGPLISVSGTTGLSVQYTGFGPTRELDFFLRLARADDVAEAIDAQRYFDFGAQNWMYVDDHGNIGYKTSGEIPLREDLQAGTVAGLPPYFIRNGTGGNEWIADPTRAEDQASPYEILPFAEMDGLVNPARGWISNANQDPTGQTFDNDPLNELRPGGGIRYIAAGHADGNRNARISDRLQEEVAGGSVSFEEMQSIQADVKLNDAEVLVPYITAAMEAAQAPGAHPGLAALGADPRVQEAVARLAAWDFSTPTGIAEGYDAADPPGARSTPTQEEISASVAATVYSLWRGRALASFVDAPLIARGLGNFLPAGDQAMSALRHLLEGTGTGASGIAFFAGPGDRDTKILQALEDALALAAGPAFAPAFGGSTDIGDYRWGRLHRIVFRHPLGGPFSIPPGAGFTDLGSGLPGVATDGGFGVVDASSHNPRASTLNGFMFSSGPARRFVAEARTSHPNAVEVIPGGESGNPAGPWFGNQLGLWLTNDYHRATTQVGEVLREATLRSLFLPLSAGGLAFVPGGVGPGPSPAAGSGHKRMGGKARARGRRQCVQLKQKFSKQRPQSRRCRPLPRRTRR
jgi:penicillin G amidase